MQGDLFQRTPVLMGENAGAKREEIYSYFVSTFNRYEQLFEMLACEKAYFIKPISLRHPLIFYLGHTATFYINKLILAGLLQERINPEFEAMLMMA